LPGYISCSVRYVGGAVELPRIQQDALDAAFGLTDEVAPERFIGSPWRCSISSRRSPAMARYWSSSTTRTGLIARAQTCSRSWLAVGGIAGMLILYGVGHQAAAAAVLIYEAVGLLVPLTGGGIAYLILRREFGPLQTPQEGIAGASQGSG
jgi:hypothetical protein